MALRSEIQDQPRRGNDELLEAYLGEIFAPLNGVPSLSVDVLDDLELDDYQSIEVLDSDLARPLENSVALQTIAINQRITPTIRICRESGSKRVRNESESLLVLLQCLHFLNQPLSSALRQSFLQVAEQSIDDYRAAAWQISFSFGAGVMSEVPG